MAEQRVRLAGVAEIAELLRIDADVAADLPASEALRRAGTPFPRPIDTLIDHGPVWDLDDVDEWRRSRRQVGARL